MGKAETSLPQMEKINRWMEQKCSNIPGVVINSPEERAPHILNIAVPGIKPEVMVQALAEKDIYVSTKSACSSRETEPSRTLIAMGYDKERASSALRISLTYENTFEEAERFIAEFSNIVASLKKVVNKQ
jgi:cysteine desulfurase